MAKVGYCNICGRHGPLTADHVPPKGSGSLSDAELKTLSRYLSPDTQRPKIYQNGVKFPTLCGECNNTHLGERYDPALIGISNDISRLVRVQQRKMITLPPEVRIRTQPQRVARAVVGHLLAVLPRHLAGAPLVHAPFPDAMREYFLDESKPLPTKMAIYYWVYPSTLHVVARGFGVNDLRSPGWVVGDMIKWFPLGYWVTWDKPSSVQVRLPVLVVDRTSNVDDDVELSVALRDVPPVEWPEQPGAWGTNLFCDEMTFVAYRRKRRRAK
jgi:hypothetical protein